MRVRYAIQTGFRGEAQAAYAIELLLEIAGMSATRTHQVAEADLVYAEERPADLPSRVLWIPADAISDWDCACPQVSSLDGLPYLFQTRRPGPPLGDVVYSTYAVVTGAAERNQPKNAYGVPFGSGSFLEKAGLLMEPIVARYTEALVEALERVRGAALTRVALWPEGKTYGVVISHDVDKPFSHAPASYHRRKLGTALAMGGGRAALFSAKQWARSVFRSTLGLIPSPRRDPNFCFNQWMELESRLRARSCFYVAVTSSAEPNGSVDDVDYHFREPALIEAMRRAAAEGWEIGLHASINARRSPMGFQTERNLLQSCLPGHPVRGLRHHYWALDPEWPEQTLRDHASAGFEYDSSLGMNDIAGFRRGMAWPFRPFDRQNGRALPILEVPPTLMDGGIFYRDVTPQEGEEQIRQHLALTFKHHGAAVLDWHLEQLNPFRLRGAGPVLARVLMDLAGDSDIYWASPVQVADWWRQRQQRIAAQ